MNFLKKIVDYLLKNFSKVQLGSIIVIILFAFFIGDSNLFARLGYDSEIRDLKKQIIYYREQTEEDKRKLNELRSNKDNIEKFARENYLMKKPEEEVFIIE